MTLRTLELPVGAPAEQTTTASRVLLRAADLLEEHGWVQRQYGDDAVGFCLVGAIDRVTFYCQGDLGPSIWSEGPELITEIESRLCRFVGPEDVEKASSARNALVLWNDRRERTKDQVVNVLREAAGEGRSDS